MSRSLPGPAELRGLLDALCDETITPEQTRRLEELVLTDPEAAAGYVQYMSFAADLGRQCGGHSHDPDYVLRQFGHAVPATPPRRRVRRVLGWAALSASLLAAVGVGLSMRPAQVGLPPERPEAVDDSVAVVVRTYRAEWGENSLPVQAGAVLPRGRLVLKSGAAHVQFYNGAAAVVEGPAEVQLLSRTEAYCTAGKIRVTVPPQAVGFTVGTPEVEVVDRGTEFAVRASDGRSEVHVFQGKVDVQAPGVGRELTAGQAVVREANGPLISVAPNPGGFLAAGELAARVAAETVRWQAEWDDACREYRKDPSLVVYYPFGPGVGGNAAVRNEAAGANGVGDGAVVGCSWGTGRWPGKPALEFRRVSDRVRFSVPGQFDSVTLAAWVRPDALPNENNSLMMSDGWEAGELHWQIGTDGKLVLGVRGPRTKDDPLLPHADHLEARDAIPPGGFGRWVHLAVVYDRPARQVTHYVDGRPVSQESIGFDIPLRVGDAELGNWNIAGYRNSTPVRYFTGGIDEFMLFSRPLSEVEVGRLVARGRPRL